MSELDQLERRMERRWQDFVHADMHEHTQAELKWLYDQYIRSLEAYVEVKEQPQATQRTGGAGVSEYILQVMNDSPTDYWVIGPLGLMAQCRTKEVAEGIILALQVLEVVREDYPEVLASVIHK